MELPLAPFERIAKKSGDLRVSAEAVKELRDTVEEIAFSLAAEAVTLANHAKRKTIKEEDIKLLADKYKQSKN